MFNFEKLLNPSEFLGSDNPLVNKAKELVENTEKENQGATGSYKKELVVSGLRTAYNVLDGFANLDDLTDEYVKNSLIPFVVDSAVYALNKTVWKKGY